MMSKKKAMTGAIINAVRGNASLKINARLQYEMMVSNDALMILAYSS